MLDTQKYELRYQLNNEVTNRYRMNLHHSRAKLGVSVASQWLSHIGDICRREKCHYCTSITIIIIITVMTRDVNWKLPCWQVPKSLFPPKISARFLWSVSEWKGNWRDQVRKSNCHASMLVPAQIHFDFCALVVSVWKIARISFDFLSPSFPCVFQTVPIHTHTQLSK